MRVVAAAAAAVVGGVAQKSKDNEMLFHFYKKRGGWAWREGGVGVLRSGLRDRSMAVGFNCGCVGEVCRPHYDLGAPTNQQSKAQELLLGVTDAAHATKENRKRKPKH